MAIYFLAYGVKMHFKSNSRIWKIACALISLINEKAKPRLDDKNLDEYVKSFTEENF